MKRNIPGIIILILLLIGSLLLKAQCPAGATTATMNWDNLDYLTRNGTYTSFVTNAMRDTQYFTLGVNRAKIQLNAISTNGENTLNIAEIGAFGTGADVEYSNNGIITITFDTVVYNFRFSIFDIDLSQSVRVTATDGSAIPIPLNVTMASLAAGVHTIVGSGTPTPTATASNTAVGNNDTRGTLNISVAGTEPGSIGIKTVVINIGFGGGVAGDFWMSDLSACVFGSFPLNYYMPQQPWIGQPAYYLVTPDNNSVYLFNPLTGKADWLFSEPSSPWVNSMAYDYKNRVLYYVMDHPTVLSTNRSLKKYDFNTESISTVVADLSTIGIPLYDIRVESAGAAFYNNSLFLGIEGTNSAKNSARESLIWRIDFNAALQPIKVAQVFGRPADNGTGTLTHDWGDFTIKDGTLYDFNTGNVGSTSQFIHFNMQTGAQLIYNTNGSPAPIQAGQTYDGKIYWTGGQSPETGRVALYNENGTIGAKIVATVTPCSPPWVGRAGDASDPFRPKSDFGDAPASYDPIANDKATHEYDCNLRLGAIFDREWDKTPSANATADGTDEDGILTLTVLTPGTINYVQNVSVYNNTGAPATLIGWLDYNGNGVYDASEGRSVTVPTSAAQQTITLSWMAITVGIVAGQNTFLRLRLTSQANGMTVSNPTRWYSNGEVEDYMVFVNVLLPVDILSFTAQAQQNQRVVLDWTSSKEINFLGFDIERSKDGLSWQKIGFVAAESNGGETNDYSYTDNDPLTGVSYYRLRLVDIDGNSKYSTVRSVEIKGMNHGIRVVPNPVVNFAVLKFSAEKNENAQIFIINAEGKRMRSKMITIKAGQNEINLDQWSSITPGVYVVQVVTSEKTMNVRVVVQR